MEYLRDRDLDEYEDPFERHARMLRKGLDESVKGNFMTQAQADEWYAHWVMENNREDILQDNE